MTLPVRPIRILIFAQLNVSAVAGSACAEAAGIIRSLDRIGAAVVLCSLNTRAQLEQIQQDLGLDHPFIAEGGAAAFVPEGYFSNSIPRTRDVAGYHAIELGRPYEVVARALKDTAARQRVEIVAFRDLSVQQVARECRLSLLQARLAKLRDYGECFKLAHPDEADLRRLTRGLQAANLHLVEGAPFHHVSASNGFGPAINQVRRLYEDAASDLLITSDALAGAGGDDLVDWAQAIERLIGMSSHPEL